MVWCGICGISGINGIWLGSIECHSLSHRHKITAYYITSIVRYTTGSSFTLKCSYYFNTWKRLFGKFYIKGNMSRNNLKPNSMLYFIHFKLNCRITFLKTHQTVQNMLL